MRAGLLLLAVACGEVEPAPASGPGASAAVDLARGDRVLVDDDPCDDPGSWARTGHPFALTWCTGCHASTLSGDARFGAPEYVDFDTQAGMVNWGDAVLEQVESGAMPPGGGPTAAEVERLRTWLTCGAPGDGSTLGGGTSDPVPFDPDIVTVDVVASPDVPGALWVMRRASSLYGEPNGPRRMLEDVEVDGQDAWLWSRTLRDGDGTVVESVSWDPPLRIGHADTDSWTVETTATVEPAGVVRAESWTFERFVPAVVDGWSIDSDPDRVLGVEAGGREEGWDLSSTYGVVRRWSLDPDGAGVVSQQALEQPVGAYTNRYPLVAGDRRRDRLVRTEAAP